MSRISTLLCFTLFLTLCCATAHAGDLEAFKAAYARASEAHEKKAYPQALDEWKTCATLLEAFEENDKVAAIKELVLLRQGECLMHAAEADPADVASIDAAVAAFEGLLKRKKLYSLKKEELNAQLAVALSMKGNASARAGDLARARKAGRQAQTLWSKIPAGSPYEEYRARTNSLLGRVFRQTTDFREAEAALQQAIALWEKSGQVEEGLRERNLLYALHLDMGKVLQAEEELGKLYAELKTGGRERTPLAVECLTNRGVAALYLGAYNEADDYLAAAEALARETAGVSGAEAIANNLGILRYRQGLAYDALAWFDTAGKGADALVKARSLSNAGAVYGNQYFAEPDNQDHFANSEKKLGEAMTLAQSIEDLRTWLSASGNLGRLHTTRARARKDDKGQEDCAKAQDIMAPAWVKVAGKQDLLLETASLAQNLGDLHLLMAERFPATPAHPSLCQKGDLRACAADFFRQALDAASRMGNMEDLWYAHYGLARAYRAEKNRGKAVEEYTAAIAIVESMRDLLTGSASVGFLHDKHMVYTELIDLLLETWAETKAPKEKQQAALQALEVLEKSRLSALKSIFEQALPAERQRLGQELAGLRFREAVLRLDPKGNAKELDALKKSAADLEKRLEQGDTLLQRPGLALAACQKRIRPDQAVLEFYYNDAMIYVWKIDGAGVTLYATERTIDDAGDLRDFMNEYVENFTKNIVAERNERSEQRVINTRDNLKGIYQKLFVETGLQLDPGYTRLTIISYRRLSVVPFAALLTDATTGAVLGGSYDIDTLVSLQQLLQTNAIAEKSLYAIGNPEMPPGIKSGAETRGDGGVDPDRPHAVEGAWI